MTTDIFQLATDSYTISDVWQACRLPDPPVPGNKSCRSPFRDDRNPSFSISADGRLWHDFGSGEGGDVVSFVQRALGIDAREARLWFAERLGIDVGSDRKVRVATAAPSPPERRPKPPKHLKEITWPGEPIKGTARTWRTFAEATGFTFPAVHAMIEAGILRFVGADGHKCFVITDDTLRAAEIRRIDGGTFGKGMKAYPLPGVDKSWLPGAAWLHELGKDQPVLLCEGATDMLAAWDAYAKYRRASGSRSWLPLAVLGASCRKLHPDLHQHFRHRLVRIAPDGDDAGRKMSQHWGSLLSKMGCAVEIVDMPEGRDLRDMLGSGELQPEEVFS